jgi:DNA primase
MAFVDLNDSIIAQVRSAADIVDFVQQVTPLKLAGKSYKGLCPFHREKSPSFHVDRVKGLFYCFGCGTGGDVFKFLALTERFTFPEAVEHVANRVGIELPRRRKTSRDSDKDDLFEVIDDASEAFHQALNWTPNAADEYLKQRRVSADIITKYGFGFAPESWDYLLRRLGQKHGEKRLEQVGLITPRKEKTGYYDRFRNRLMIPIHSDTGALVGFGGRSLDGGEPKYLNSPESELFNKSRLLYNIHRSKDAMRRYDRAILVEGYFDAIAIDHAGVPGVIASMGTSLTAGQASLMRRFTRNVVIAYDGDAAGRAATLRAAQVLLAAGLNVSALDLRGEKDPDSLVQKHGTDKFLEVLSSALDIFEFGLQEWGADAAQLTGKAGATQQQAQERQLRRPIPNGEKFVLTAAVQGRLTPEQVARLSEELFEDAACKTVFSIMKSDLAAGQPIDFEKVQTHLRGDAEQTLLSELSLTEDIDDRILERLDENLRPMERGYLNRRNQQLQREIVDAERNGDSQRVEQLVTEKMDLTRMLSSLK